MKRNRFLNVLACAALVVAVVAGAAIAAGTQGSQTNPLVTLDYLNEVAVPEILKKVEAQVKTRYDKLKEDQTIPTLTFQTVELKEDEVFLPAAGSQFLIRSGELNSTDALVDLTTGEVWVNDGSLVANHLYIATGDGEAVTAAGDCVILVQGGYQTK